jgi:hypothetical protein
MGMRTGIANLPLHGGKAPRWLFTRMKGLAREIAVVIIRDFGPEELLRRLSDPHWFQAFGGVLGFDWHSSGVTTTVCGALKEGLKDLQGELNLFVAGGKGGRSRKTPSEIEGADRFLKVDPKGLVYASRLSAKVDSSALQDGYQIYQHTFFFTGEGSWAVVQQGMNDVNGYARRYHWLGDCVEDFVCEPHSAVCCDFKGEVLNLVSKDSEEARKVTTELACLTPDKLLKDLKGLKDLASLDMPRRHFTLLKDINPERLEKIFISTYERSPEDFERLLGMPGVGPKTIRALSLIGELVYGIKTSFRDPVRYSFAHGGKDGYPFPVDRLTYDESIDFLRRSVDQARVGNTEKLKALKRLGSLEKPGG